MMTPTPTTPQAFLLVARLYDGDDCLTWPFATVKGYARVWNGSRVVLVSRMFCEEINGPAPTSKHQAAHSCGKGHLGCITKRHVRWATRKENEADKIEHGTAARGERQGQSKLDRDDVIRIRDLAGDISQRALARMFGVSQAQIWRIISDKQWNWMET